MKHSFIVLMFFVCSLSSRCGWGESIQLALQGKALQKIVVSPEASVRVRKAADSLASYLKRITKAEFEVAEGDGAKGIALGAVGSFPVWRETSDRFDANDVRRREEYLLRAHAEGLLLIGATDLAVEHSVWDLLHRFGHRQYFPGANWEIVPAHPALQIDIDVFEAPDYLSRRIWYGYGDWGYNVEPYRDWCAKNRCLAGIGLKTGHAYDGVVRAAAKEFAEHPEYWPLRGGKRQPVANPKPCLGNPAVRRLFVRYALDKFDRDPQLDSVSMDPSDGGGWCECQKCAALGSVSDQAVALGNEVAAAVNAKYPGKFIGMYAYNYHSPPPKVVPHPQLVVSVATSFLKGGLRLEEIIAGWSRHQGELGIREYYGVNVWDRDLPGRARGGNLPYLSRTIPDFHARGARFMSAESSDNWGPNGLGYYLASRMLWDVDQAKRTAALREDFLTRCFGPAGETMGEFYEQLDSSQSHLVFADQLGRMFRTLRKARVLTAMSAGVDEARRRRIFRRLDDLTLYVRYVDLYQRYRTARGASRQAAFEAMIRHSYRMRTSMMVHSKAIYRDVTARDKEVSIPKQATWSVAEPKNPWKSSQPFSQLELDGYLAEGVERYQLVQLDFQPIEFSRDLMPATSLGLTVTSPGAAPRGRGRRSYHVYVEEAPAVVELKVIGGLIAHYRDRGNIRIELFKIKGASETGERETLVASDRSVPPDGAARTVKLTVKQAGLHRLNISDGGDLTRVEWPPGQRVCFESSMANPINTNGRWSLYFYVPRGTRVVGLFAKSRGKILGPDGKVMLDLEGDEEGYHSVPTPPGADGKLWKIQQAANSIRLLTVPPYLARSPSELLLPREVVEKDSRR